MVSVLRSEAAKLKDCVQPAVGRADLSGSSSRVLLQEEVHGRQAKASRVSQA